ncbi:vitamin B12 dependent methionine synthase [Raoultibacter phocaeensis]|uniref:vitamin B12 dependent methionine synthase n=1 Tax=Raoultibacter phocaeensis TaxID=2479841 RepID=UPI00111A92FD|nr:vitamin B12 dependent methionine synthase [Raoultibacter phocaeensis]
MDYKIDRTEVLRYLGYAGQVIEPHLHDRIDAIIDRVGEELNPTCVAKRFAVQVRGTVTRNAGASGSRKPDGDEVLGGDSEQGGGARQPDSEAQMVDAAAGERERPFVEVLGTPLMLEGFDIVRHLNGACECVLLACTLGAKSEQELARLKVINPLDALVYDAACSALIERVADAAEATVVAEAAMRGLQANWRYSPGYGDLPLAVQPRLVAVLGAFESLGLSVTDTDLLVPTKSITAIIGLFDGPVADAEVRVCSLCRMRDFCTFRTTGRVCHG